mmetsp:Transcript_23540/g.44427  ORF Transcript_23540/g.44427 Transcript_23540/m.44427 type:complete len:196 (+) Transcript_23540:88-675(+)
MPLCGVCGCDKPNSAFTKKQAQKARAGGDGSCLECSESAPAADSKSFGAASSEELPAKKWSEEFAEMLPDGGLFSLSTLADWNGVNRPMCLALCGKVVDVSSSANFGVNQGYGKLWAGKETTYSMATVSLNPADANRLDFELADFTDLQIQSLAGWYKHFTTKYPVVGTLQEMCTWDFSSIEKLAEELPAPAMTK